MTSLSIKVYGRVQGVWFRASTKNKADELGLAGNVRNMPDGSVYIEVSGEKAAVNDFVKWCRDGPDLARVDRVETTEIEKVEGDIFEVVR